MKPSQQLRLFLMLVVAAANILVIGLSWRSLHLSWHNYEQRAETQTQNIAIALDQSVSKSIEKIDLSLQVVVDELERHLAHGKIDEKTIDSYLAKTTRRVEEVEAMRVVNAQGLVFVGNLGANAEKINVSDRDYFTTLRDHPDSGLLVTEPLFGRLVKHYIIIFARRVNAPDGSFAGVAYATVPLNHFTRLLEQFDVGAHGTVALRDDKLGLVTRLPPIPNSPAGQIGNKQVSPEFKKASETGLKVATFHTRNASDGSERMVTVRSVESAPFIAIVGLASEDYLHEWRYEIYKTVGFAGSFIVLSLLSVVAITRLLRDAEIQEARIHALAFYDALTGLPALRLAEDRLEMVLSQMRRQGGKAGLMFVDLDGFKNINDSYGHEAGDCVLKEVAQRIGQTIRVNDTAARIGGDEFLVILGAIPDTTVAAEVANKIIDAVARPIDFRGTQLFTSCSIGISLFPQDGNDASSLKARADKAMYSVKHSGKNRFAFFESPDAPNAQASLGL